MAEAIISRRGYGPEGKPTLYTQTFTGNAEWTVPTTISGSVKVLLFGGGGAGTCDSVQVRGGGGGGWMNNGDIILTPGEKIKIIVGRGGTQNEDYVGQAGGSSSFGSYLSANGGSGGYSSGGDGGAGGGCRGAWGALQFMEDADISLVEEEVEVQVDKAVYGVVAEELELGVMIEE